MDRCEPKGEQPRTDLPPRSAGEPIATGKRASLCMRAVFCICLTLALSGWLLASPLEGRVRRTSLREAEAACRAERREQAMLALKLLAHNRQSLSATNKERCKRARRSNGSLRAEGRAAQHGLAAALRERTHYGGEPSGPLHEGRILHLPNVGLERLAFGQSARRQG